MKEISEIEFSGIINEKLNTMRLSNYRFLKIIIFKFINDKLNKFLEL